MNNNYLLWKKNGIKKYYGYTYILIYEIVGFPLYGLNYWMLINGIGDEFIWDGGYILYNSDYVDV